MTRDPEEALANSVEIHNAIRAAVAHERAALNHEDKYEQQMKAAGASMYAAFATALKLTEDYQGRQIDDSAVLRIYRGTKPRRWWDAHLAAAKGGDREYAGRLIQWHIDPDQARRRRAQHAIACDAVNKRVAKQRTNAAHGSYKNPKIVKTEPRTEDMRALAEEPQVEVAAAKVTLEDLLGEVNRLQSAARKVEAGHRGEAMEAVRAAARELERWIP